jgi:hypothetical protein
VGGEILTDQEFEEYLNTKYKKLIGFYDRRSIWNKRGYRICSVFVIVVSGLLAPLIGTGSLSKHEMVGALISASIVVVSAILAHFQFNENWLSYRATWDALEREPHLRIAGIGEYEGAMDRNSVFVNRVEAIAAREGSEWLGRHSHVQKANKEQGGDPAQPHLAVTAILKPEITTCSFLSLDPRPLTLVRSRTLYAC